MALAIWPTVADPSAAGQYLATGLAELVNSTNTRRAAAGPATFRSYLFVQYKYWTEKAKPFPTVGGEVAALAQQGDDFRRLIELKPDDVLHLLATFLDLFDISTAYGTPPS